MRSQLDAEQIGRAARSDLQFTVPRRPVLRSGVRLRASGDVVVLDGSDRAQVFSGAFARQSLVRLATACDGARTHGEIADLVGLDEESVASCLALLWTAGAIEEAPRPDAPDPSPFTVLLSRLGNATGANASWSDALDRLATRGVRLRGDAELVAVATGALRDVVPLVDDGDGDDDALTVFFETTSATATHDGGRMLRVRADGSSVAIGPYVDLAVTPCLDCGRRGDAPLDGPVPAHVRDLVVGLAAHHVVAVASRATTTHLPIDTAVVDVATLTTSFQPAVTVPGCPRCSASVGEQASTVPAAAVYEASVAIPPRAFLSPKDHQAHYYAGNQSLQSQFRSWPSRPRTALPPLALDLLAGPAHAPHDPGTVPTALEVATVLAITFGIDAARSTDRRVRRWTASGGNLGCTVGHLVVRADAGLPRGVHAYSPDAHALVRLSAEVPPGTAPYELVVTGDLPKIMTKYGTFGLRLTFLDAGSCLASARDVAEHLGHRLTPATTWDDAALAAVLGIDLGSEPVLAVAELGGAR